MPQPVLLPDTNIWVYLVDAEAVDLVRKEAQRSGVAIAVCPAIVFECLRARLEPAAKKRRIDALTRGAWRRLMPEVYKESKEAVDVIQRARPEWIDPAPNLRGWMHMRADWESAWWMRARKDLEGEARRIRLLEGSDHEVALNDAKVRRELATEGHLKFDRVAFDLLAVPQSPSPWWDGRPFEPWTVQVATVLLHSIQRRQGAYYDWIAPWLRFSLIDASTWLRLWTREVTKDQAPLAWLRWAFEHVQATRSTTNGTPVDNQIATYLPECDIFVTSDKAFAECVEKVRPHSAIPLGEGRKMPGSRDAVDAVVDVIRELAG